MKKILIISAMADVELNHLIENLQEKQIIESKICKFYKGKIYGNEIILCDSKVGLINNAAATTLAIEKFEPDYIINQGCAGAISRDIHKSDIVIGTDCINITSINTKFKEEGKGYNLDDWELINFVAGEKDRLIPQNGSEELIEKIKKIENKYQYGKVHYGRIGSGDIWNSECDWLIKMNEKYGILCEEMEGIAIYTVANQYEIPVIDIRVISDNEILKEEYDRNLSIRAQEFTMNLLKEIKEMF